MYKCPLCKMEIADLSNHFRFVHKFDSDQVVNTTFSEIKKLDDRVSNLCELLEIREK